MVVNHVNRGESHDPTFDTHRAFITLCLGVAGVYLSSSPANARIPYTDVSQIADGQRVYQQYCASCHGANLEGEPNWQRRDVAGMLPAPPHDPS